ncbi:MAG: folate hydrolase, partial [Acidobacteria bacterium]|nr:folate hydrolase [Acidobacteriota bacterium]
MHHPFRVVALIACVAGIPVTAGSQQTPGIRGFTSPHAVEERQREKALQALPVPENLREYMKTISAEPHHAGSAGSRKVADYVVGKFKSWGLNASLEQFEALMPYPTERVLELVEPTKYVAALKEPVVPDDPDSGDAGQLPTFNAYSADGDVTASLVYVNY